MDRAAPGSPSLVLVHGYVASSRYMIPALRSLAPFCRVYAPDLPGWGESSKPEHALGISELADLLAEWTVAMELGQPIFLGNSFGCQVLAELAVRHPHIPSALIFIGPTVDRCARTLLRQAWRLALDIPRERPSLWLVELWDLLHMGGRRAIQTARVMIDDRIEEKLPHIGARTLVVRGSRDPIVRQGWAEEATRLVPNGKLAVLPGAGHAVNYSAPQLLTAAILPFIESVSRRIAGLSASP